MSREECVAHRARIASSPNRVLRVPGFTLIGLTRGLIAVADESAFDLVAGMKWYALACGSKFYACHTKRRKDQSETILLHRHLKNAPAGYVVDHISGDTMDNRDANLRVCTSQQNLWNQAASKNSASGVRGVHQDKKSGRWKASIMRDRKTHWLGSFDTIEEASAARHTASLRLHGQFAPGI